MHLVSQVNSPQVESHELNRIHHRNWAVKGMELTVLTCQQDKNNAHTISVASNGTM